MEIRIVKKFAVIEMSWRDGSVVWKSRFVRKNSEMTKDLIKLEMMCRVMSFRPNWIDYYRYEVYKKREEKFKEFNGIKN